MTARAYNALRKEVIVTTALIIICIAFCVGVVLAIVGHLGVGIVLDKRWRERLPRHYAFRHQR
jgi:hypothetical protein